jgi:hypothetical protein
MKDAHDKHLGLDDAEQDQVTAVSAAANVGAKLRTQAVCAWCSPDLFAVLPDFADEGKGANRTVGGDVVTDVLAVYIEIGAVPRIASFD